MTLSRALLDVLMEAIKHILPWHDATATRRPQAGPLPDHYRERPPVASTLSPPLEDNAACLSGPLLLPTSDPEMEVSALNKQVV